jgi:predicted DNA-binding transcriptional regulator YafY
MASAFAAYRDDGEPTEVRVRFGPAAARYVQESRWHASQRVTPLRDGSVVAEFRVSGTEEIKSWILGFGAKAVVLAPESLRLEIGRELRDLATAYATADDGVDPPADRRASPRPDRRPRRARQATNRET